MKIGTRETLYVPLKFEDLPQLPCIAPSDPDLIPKGARRQCTHQVKK